MSQQFCLKWNNHTTNMLQVFENLLSTEALVDVTLACDGLSLKAHKMVLSACSPFFQSLFLENPCKHPIVIMKDMRYSDLKAIIDFMYRGEVNVSHDQLSALLKTAETLKVKGLAEVTGENRLASGIVQQEIAPTPVAPMTTPTPVVAPMTPLAQRTETPPLQGKRKRGRPRKRSLSDSNRSDDEGIASKIKERDSPDVEELSGDASMEATSDIRSGGLPNSSNSLSQVQSHASSNNVNSFSKSHLSTSSSNDPQGDDLASGDENEFEVEPSKLLEQTLTTDNVPSSSQNSTGHINLPSVSGLEISRRSMSSTDSMSQALVPADSLGSNLQGPDSPQDIKPQILSFDDPPISPVAGTSHGSERSMMMYMDQSGVASIPGPSNYQDNSALVPHDSQPQGINIISNPAHNGKPLNAKKIIFPMTLSPLPQLFLINSGMWEERSEIEIVDSRTLSDTMPELKREDPDVKPFVNTTYSKLQLIDSETPLPVFSPTVSRHLLEGSDVTAIWGSFIDECAKYYFQRYPNIQNSSEYQAIGRKMYNKYPTIELEGKEPWSFFCKSLSQKIRHMKWKIKRKSMGLSRSVTSKISRKSREKLKFRNLKIDRRYRPSKQYKALVKELSEGWANNSITESRINEIVRDTNKSRRTWLASHKDRKIFSIIEEFPCFTEGKYVINDFLFLINKSDTTEMMQRLESLFSAVGSMMEPPVENKSFSQKMQILSYMEREVAFTRGKIVSESIFIHKTDLPEEEIMQHVKSIENSFPQLYIFSNGDELKRTLVAGDTTIVNTRTTDLSEAILVLIAAYYTFSLDYPPIFAQTLGLLQNFVVGESYEGIKSPKYVKFMHELTNSISDEE